MPSELATLLTMLVAGVVNALLRRRDPSSATTDDAPQGQVERLLENGSLEAGWSEGALEAAFPRSQRFEGKRHHPSQKRFRARLTQTALCREVFIREYAAQQSSSW
jgi:hypothetical protein